MNRIETTKNLKMHVKNPIATNSTFAEMTILSMMTLTKLLSSVVTTSNKIEMTNSVKSE